MRNDKPQPGTPEYVAMMDQVRAGYQELSSLHAAEYHGMVKNGVPKWAAAMTIGTWIAVSNAMTPNDPDA